LSPDLKEEGKVKEVINLHLGHCKWSPLIKLCNLFFSRIRKRFSHLFIK
jgi:hypothetical protein